MFLNTGSMRKLLGALLIVAVGFSANGLWAQDENRTGNEPSAPTLKNGVTEADRTHLASIRERAEKLRGELAKVTASLPPGTDINRLWAPARQYVTATKALFEEITARSDEDTLKQLHETEHALDRLALRIEISRHLIKKAPKPTTAKQPKDPDKEREKILKRIEDLKRKDLSKVQQRRLDLKSDFKDTQDIEDLLEKAMQTLKTIEEIAAGDDLQELFTTWPGAEREFKLLLDAAANALKSKKLPLQFGYTKDRAEQKILAQDEASGCSNFMRDDDRYTTCRRRGMPKAGNREFHPHGPFALQRRNLNIRDECQGTMGPEWHQAPGAETWKYADELNRGFVYYVFVEGWDRMESLLTKKDVSDEEIEQAFNDACIQLPSGAMKLIYVGTQPINANMALDIVFRNIHVPSDALGFDYIEQQRELAPAKPFTLDAFLFDSAFTQLVRRINAVITPFEAWQHALAKLVLPEWVELKKAEKTRKLTPDEKQRMVRLEHDGVAFLIKYDQKLEEGVRLGRTNYRAAADALKDALPLLYDTAKRAELEASLGEMSAIAVEFDQVLDERIKLLNSGLVMEGERSFTPGDVVHGFFKVTGSTPPKLAVTLEITKLVWEPGKEAPSEFPVGTMNRSHDMPSQTTAQRLITYAVDGQKYWVAYFEQPFMIIPAGTIEFPDGTEEFWPAGIRFNSLAVLEVPGTYMMTITVKDTATNTEALQKSFRFSVTIPPEPSDEPSEDSPEQTPE
ncbi:MAG: hypothetical protein Q8Q39_02190 [bacterium]|nr:hypothetical protein [bacterium]